jgi:hypothetical protein
VQEKKSATFLPSYPQEKSTGGIELPVEKRCEHAVAWGFSPVTERGRATSAGTKESHRAKWRNGRQAMRNHPPPGGAAGYHSPVRSNTGDEIDRIAIAIDQLESDVRAARGGAGEAELASRIAVLWQMVGALDPELARRARRYTAPADGTPSA